MFALVRQMGESVHVTGQAIVDITAGIGVRWTHQNELALGEPVGALDVVEFLGRLGWGVEGVWNVGWLWGHMTAALANISVSALKRRACRPGDREVVVVRNEGPGRYSASKSMG